MTPDFDGATNGDRRMPTLSLQQQQQQQQQQQPWTFIGRIHYVDLRLATVCFKRSTRHRKRKDDFSENVENAHPKRTIRSRGTHKTTALGIQEEKDEQAGYIETVAK
jgi:hypothetical protein